MSLVTEVYRITKAFPKEETYGLVAQMRKSAISVPSNIAEGYGRKSTAEYIRFLNIAMGSMFELQTQLEIALNLKYMLETDFRALYEGSREIERMQSSLINKLSIGRK